LHCVEPFEDDELTTSIKRVRHARMIRAFGSLALASHAPKGNDEPQQPDGLTAGQSVHARSAAPVGVRKQTQQRQRDHQSPTSNVTPTGTKQAN
jgi:hypothetical protein